MLIGGAAAVVVACGKDQPVAVQPPPPQSVDVTLSVLPSVVVPGEATTLTSEAKAANARLTAHGMIFSGLFDTAVSFPVADPEDEIYVLTLQVPHAPIQGTLNVTAFAKAGDAVDSARGSLVIQDDGPPTLSFHTQSWRAPGDTLFVSLDASDASGIQAVVVTVTGAALFQFTQGAGLVPSLYRVFNIPIPATATMGDSAVITVDVTDGFDKQTVQRYATRIADGARPDMTNRIIPSTCGGFLSSYCIATLFAGDSAFLLMQATDNYRLGWAGYRLKGTSDSIPLQGKSDSARISLAVPTGRNEMAMLSPFVRDSFGNELTYQMSVELIDALRQPISVLDGLSGWEPAAIIGGEIIYDQKRDCLYTINASSVTVISLNPMGLQAPIPIPGRPLSLDLTPGGDSLVVLAGANTMASLFVGQNPASLFVVDLSRPTAPPTVLPLSLGSSSAYRMRVAANGHAFVTVSTWDTGPASTLLDVDLGAGTQRTRSVSQWPLALTRSGDHSLIVARDDRGVATYDAATDSLSALVSLPGRAWPEPDENGTRLLIGNQLYDRSLVLRQTIPLPCAVPVAGGLSPDGQRVYLGERNGCSSYGYQLFVTGADGAFETVFLPVMPARLVPLPDNERLLVIAFGWIGLVDLR